MASGNTAYDLLQAKADASYNRWKKAQDHYNGVVLAVKNDPIYVANSERIAVINAAANANNGVALKVGTRRNAHFYGPYEVWISASNFIFYDNTSQKLNSDARSYNLHKDELVAIAQASVDSTKRDYLNDQAALEKYENTSPVAQQAIKKATSEANFKTSLIIGGVVVFAILVFTIIYIAATKANKNKSIAAPAAPAA